MKGHQIMNKILVTGGSGFIGSHLCEKLLEKENQVICLDNLYSSSLTNIEHLLPNANFQFIEHDISNPIMLEVNQIYNLACPASPVHYQRDPVQTTKTILMGAINMLDLARKMDAKILQASTSEVYGDPMISPQPEAYWGNVNPVGVRSCYDEGKRCAETLFFDYLRQYKSKIKVARIFNTYGPKMAVDDGRVVSNFVTQALAHHPITIYGSGLQTRSFCFIDDLVTGLITLMQIDENLTTPICLGNPTEITISDLASMVIGLTNSRSKLTNCPLPEDDPRQRKPDVSLAKNFLEWNPQIDIHTGLRRTITYFQSLFKEPDWKLRGIQAQASEFITQDKKELFLKKQERIVH